MPVLFAAAEFQHGNERAVAECFHVVLYCRVTALSHNIRAHDEMVNLDKRTLSSAPWGGDPSLWLAPVCLALLWSPPFWQGWIGRSLQETPCAELCETGCSVGLSVLQSTGSLAGTGSRSHLHPVLCSTLPAWVLLPASAICASKGAQVTLSLFSNAFPNQTFPFSFIFILLINIFSFILDPD